jgi:gliding motility-associated-like protein
MSKVFFKSICQFVIVGILMFCSRNSVAQDSPLLKWAGHFKGAAGVSDNFGYGIVTDATGNVYSTGSYSGTTDFDPGLGVFNLISAFGSQDIYVSKLDNNGNFVWAKSIGQGVLDAGYSIAVDAGGNVYITGTYRGNVDFDPGPGIFTLAGSALNFSFILKLDTDGNFLWAKPISAGSTVGSGRGIAIDNSNNVLVTGIYSGTVDFDPGAGIFNMTSAGGDEIYVIKLDANGNFVWAKSMGGTGFDRGFSIAIDNSNNVLTTGSYSGVGDFDPGAGLFSMTAVGITDIFISKLDASGNFVWAKSMGGLEADVGNSLTTDGLNNVIITGRFKSTVDFDPGAAVFNLSTGSSNEDGFIAKLDASGNFGWAVSIGGSTLQGDSGNGITTDVSGNVLVTGYFEGTVDFNFGAGTFNLTSAIFGTDIFLLKLDTNGNSIWAVQTGGNNNQPDEGNAITVDALGHIWSTGSYSTAADFDFGPCIFSLNAEFNVDINTYVEKISAGNFGPPTITSFSPTSGPIGTTITITGTNFSIIPGDNRVTFNGGAVAFGSVSTTTSITTAVPAGANSGNIGVTVGCYPIAVSVGSFIVTTGALPTITSFTPISGPIGTTVTITGTNFSTIPANNIVYFGAVRATVTIATSTQLTVTVPPGATFKPITVSVNGLTVYTSRPFVVSFAGGGPIDNCSFAPAIAIGTVSTSSFNSALCDLDGDGKMDLLIPEFSSNQLAIFRNTSVSGTVSFAPKIPLTGLTQALSTAVGDLDGDGKQDIAVANYTNGQLSVYKNLSTPGTISVATRVTYSIPAFTDDVSIADIDGDGKQDLIISASIQGLIVLRNQGSPGVIDATTFAAGVTFATGANAYPIALGDLDGDGKLDAIVPNANTYTLSVLRNTSTPGSVSFAASVTLTTNTGTPTAGFGTGYVSLGDIDGDNKLDIVAVSNTVTKLSLFRNTSTPGSLTFDPRFDIATTGIGAAPPLSDLNGDGKLDLVADNGPLQMLVFESTASSGAFNATTFKTSVIIPRASSAIPQLGDVDGDGRNDIISTATNVQVFQNLIGTISPPTIASFSPTSGILGATVNITGTNFNSLFSKTVEFNGTPATITASTATTLTVTVPAGATTGLVKVTIGCNAITGSNFTVGSPATITITTQPSDFIACVGQTATFTTAVSGTTNIIYQWQFSVDGIAPFTDIANGGSYSNATTATLSVNTIGNFGLGRYRCRINGDFAAEVITNDEGLFINPVSIAPTVLGANRCGAGSVTLTASGGTNGQYKWYTTPSGGTAIAGETNGTYVTPSITSTTNYYVSLNSNGCESTRTIVTATLTITPAPTATGVSGCPARAVTLTASGGTNGQYNWYTVATGGTAIAGATNNTYQISSLTVTSTFYVSLTISGCESTRTPVTATLLSTGCAPVISTQTLTTQVEGKIEINLQSLITTPGTLDPTSIKVITQPASGAIASIANFLLVIDYKGKPFSGKETTVIEACNTNGLCAQQTFSIEVAGDVIVFNAVSPNGDGKNEFLVLQYIESISPKNQVSIYNRWGDEVFSISDYDNKTRVFAGLSNSGSQLPSGTYFYKIALQSTGQVATGYLSLKR